MCHQKTVKKQTNFVWIFFNLQYKCGFLRVYLSRIFLEFFLKPVHPTMAVEKFQIYDINITGRYICESKSWICSYLLMTSFSSPWRKKITHFTQTAFSENIFFIKQKGEGYAAENMTKFKLARVLVTSFDIFHHLYNLYIGFCFFVS